MRTAESNPAGRMNDGVTAIAIERHRQLYEKPWTLEHDDTHAEGQLAFAALHAIAGTLGVDLTPVIGTTGLGWVKPAEGVRPLAKAGALLAAEIDRRLRTG